MPKRSKRDVFSSTNKPFTDAIIRKVGQTSRVGGKLNESEAGLTFGVIKNAEPRDEAEVMLRHVMATVYSQIVDRAARRNNSDTLEEMDMHEAACLSGARVFKDLYVTSEQCRRGSSDPTFIVKTAAFQGPHGQGVIASVQNGNPGVPEHRDSSVETVVAQSHLDEARQMLLPNPSTTNAVPGALMSEIANGEKTEPAKAARQEKGARQRVRRHV
jgi:hypothetical protein